MTRAIAINDFEIVYQQFTDARGGKIDHPKEAQHALVWLVGRKTASMGEFRIPQQELWDDAYRAEQKASAEG